MKWRGRRQSTNVIDVRLKSINIYWDDSSEPKSGSILIDTDGSVYSNGDVTTVVNIGVVPIRKARDNGIVTELTTSQKITIEILISDYVEFSGTNLTLNNPSNEDDLILVQYVQSIINNN